VIGYRRAGTIVIALVLLVAAGGAAWWCRRPHMRLQACLSSLSPTPTTLYTPSQGKSLSTSFLKDEDIISEEGTWVNGGHCKDATLCRGAGGSNISAADGRAFGTQSGAVPPPYTDSTAILTGNWGSDQFVQIMVWWDGAAGTNSDYDEVEILLRGTIKSNFARGYEINCRVGSPTPNSYIH
jgi:hypothetical protein